MTLEQIIEYEAFLKYGSLVDPIPSGVCDTSSKSQKANSSITGIARACQACGQSLAVPGEYAYVDGRRWMHLACYHELLKCNVCGYGKPTAFCSDCLGKS